jgi:hypothetical protein
VKSIDNLFASDATSVHDLFRTEGGVSSFRIPVYQRQYNWDRNNISRLLIDVRDGLFGLDTKDENTTFIGSIILVRDESREASFKGVSFSVVDGQQRLTTLALFMSILYSQVRDLVAKSRTWQQDALVEMAVEEAEDLLARLFTACVGVESGPVVRSAYVYFPRVVREEDDIRGNKPSSVRYTSPIAEYLFKFCEHYIRDEDSEFAFTASAPTEVSQPFMDRLNWIRQWLRELFEVDTEDYARWPSVHRLIDASSLRSALFPTLQRQADKIFEVRQIAGADSQHPAMDLLRIIAFGNYVLERVAVTQVIATDEAYAFSIFEALNTTGEPLTALETFKPLVIQSESAHGYPGSASAQSFSEVEEYLRTFRSYSERQAESREIVLHQALYTCGDKIGRTLNDQRSYLRNRFADAATLSAKRRFVDGLARIADYRKCFWDKVRIETQLPGHSESRLALFCLDFIRELGNALTVPILARYWAQCQNSGDWDDFIAATKAVTAFLVLRRGATGQTRGIDSDYRRMMASGPRVEDSTAPALKVGLGADASDLPSVDKLKQYLRSYLETPALGISSMAEWVNAAAQMPLYTIAKSLSKFMMLTAAHNSIADTSRPYLMKKGRPGLARNYMTIEMWRAPETSTVEHIAPQNPSGGWDPDLHAELGTVHTLGNLTLLPDAENDSIGNKPWATKKLFYLAAREEDQDMVETRLQEARAAGIQLSKKTENILRGGSALPLVSLVAEVDVWNKAIVTERSRNICELVWEEVGPWIGL